MPMSSPASYSHFKVLILFGFNFKIKQHFVRPHFTDNCIFTLFHIVVRESVSLVISRQLLTEVCNTVASLPDNIAVQVSRFLLEKVHSRVVSFEEQVSVICIRLEQILML